ncbi:MAG TPA: hypothetical protein VMA36_05450 [Candidatus Limnocylindria bacterium]|nr:hypothetical protein [Candidatus Limnocylindria bacterium]
MTSQSIRSDIVVRLPPRAAADALLRLAERRSAFAIRATCRLPTLDVEVALLRDVVVALALSRDGCCEVSWQPAGGGPFPRLGGELRIGDDGATTRVEFEGAYDDLAAPRGDAVDAELGFRFAQAAARAMLDALVAKLDV